MQTTLQAEMRQMRRTLDLETLSPYCVWGLDPLDIEWYARLGQLWAQRAMAARRVYGEILDECSAFEKKYYRYY